MTLLGNLPVALPPNARPELAIEEAHDLAAAVNPPRAEWMADSAYLDVPLSLWAEFQTSAVVANRTAIIEFRDTAPKVVANVVFPNAQAASQTIDYYASVQFSSTPTGPSGAQMAPLPALPLRGGEVIWIRLGGYQVGDVLVRATLYVLRIPTGPREEPATLVPTPLLL